MKRIIHKKLIKRLLKCPITIYPFIQNYFAQMDKFEGPNYNEKNRAAECVDVARKIGNEMYTDRSDLNNLIHYKLSNSGNGSISINAKEMPIELRSYFLQLQKCAFRFGGTTEKKMMTEMNRTKFLDVRFSPYDGEMDIKYKYDLDS